MKVTASARQTHRVVESDFKVEKHGLDSFAMFSKTACRMELPSKNV